MPAKKLVHSIKVDRKACIGAATCIITSPNAFELDDEQIAVVKKGAAGLDDDQLIMASQSCPTAAIMLFDKKGRQIFPQK